MTGSILIVSTDQAIVRITSESLADAGYTVTVAHEGMDVERYCLAEQCEVVLVEAGLKSVDGLALLKSMQVAKTSTEMIVLVQSDAQDLADLFLKSGAFDILLLPEEVSNRYRIKSVVLHAMELSRLEHRQTQAQKMESLGRMTGGVAHDFNNLLTSVMGHAHLLRQEVGSETMAYGYVEQINDTCKRAAALIHELLVVERNQTVRLERMELRKVISTLEPTLRQMLRGTIDFTLDIAGEENHVLIDRLHLEQVLSNLVVNARDAMPEGGRLNVSTRSLELDKYEARVLGVASGKFVRLDVEDAGTGMDEATRVKIFEPFFTTKTGGRGTGLGLATVRRIVSQSGGAIKVASSIGAGTTFSVFLPVLKTKKLSVEDESDSDLSKIETTSEPRVSMELQKIDIDDQATENSRTVLVVDDEDELRIALRSGLEQSGYIVLEASNGITGLACLDQNDGGVDVIVADLIMPLMNGVEFVERVQAAYPSVKVMFISGASNMSILDTSEFDDPIPLLKKPFQLTTLVRRVGELLTSTS